MSGAVLVACVMWLVVVLSASTALGIRGVRCGRGRLVKARLMSPTVYLFAGYLLIAALVTPRSPGETTSPLLWLSIVLPLAYVLATFSSIGVAKPHPALACGLGLLHAGGVCAVAAIILALVSPAFVPGWLR